MVPIYEGRSNAYKHIWNLKATERTAYEGLQLRPNNAKMILTLGDMFYQKNQFEHALATYYRGLSQNSKSLNFIHGIRMVSNE